MRSRFRFTFLDEAEYFLKPLLLPPYLKKINSLYSIQLNEFFSPIYLNSSKYFNKFIFYLRYSYRLINDYIVILFRKIFSFNFLHKLYSFGVDLRPSDL